MYQKQTMTHASSVLGYEQAVKSMTDGIQHVPDDGLLSDAIIAQIKAQNQFVTPTINVFEAGVPLIAGTDSIGHRDANGLELDVPWGLTLHYELQNLVNIVGMAPVEAINAAISQAAKWHRKGPIAGPLVKLPFFGSITQALNPTFVSLQAKWAKAPLTCVPMLHKAATILAVQSSAKVSFRFVVMISDRDATHKVLKSTHFVRPALLPILIDTMPGIFTTLQGKTHAAASKELGKEDVLESMASGTEPTCIADLWVLGTMASTSSRSMTSDSDKISDNPFNRVQHLSAEELGRNIFGFFVGQQEPQTGATTWLFQILAHRPDVVERIRVENIAVRDGDKGKRLDITMQKLLIYTTAVVKEVLRYRPPVSIISYEVTAPLPVTSSYTIPKGAIVIPSYYTALHDPQAYSDPESFDPDCWITGNAASKTKNWLAFGAGPHKCLGQRLVIMPLTHMIGKAAMEVDREHYPTSRSKEFNVVPTMLPMDGCPLTFTKRKC
ncbi:hypothetical protein E8E11_001239 [Didymella keratinophila]|nr:hypothetical protein E8E11_001239 [Didymella keratinophila]